MYRSDGQLTGVLGIGRDITERKQAEAELARLASAIDHATDSVVITDPEGTIQYVNPAFEKVTGYSRREAVGHTPRLLNSSKQNRAFYETLWKTITAGKTWSGRLINLRKDKSEFSEEATISPVFDTTGIIVNYVAIKRDVTKEDLLNVRLEQAQKMEAIGTLAGGIAHDFNNILFPIIGMSELLLEDLPAGSLEHENAQVIIEAGKRGGELVKQILAFSRQSEHKLIPVRVQQVLKEVLKLSRATIPSNIELAQDIQSECGLVLADPTQLHQIAMNLITNAYHAVQESGGKILVELREKWLGNGDVADTVLKPGHYVMLTISDTGIGIDPAVIGRIFDPYFTTKEHGKGTGLGLAVAYGIIKDHHGEVKVYSEVGKGTTFNIFIPLIEKNSDIESFEETVTIHSTGHERILLVDDEELIVRIETQMLERLGYKVTSRISSIDALEAFRANPDAIDLVLTDMTMPNMTGDQLAKKLISIKPDIPIIVCTGFSEKLNAENAKASGISGFLMKPVVKSDIAQMVRKVLDEAKG
jgi:PAS domain S-box-containing protein